MHLSKGPGTLHFLQKISKSLYPLLNIFWYCYNLITRQHCCVKNVFDVHTSDAGKRLLEAVLLYLWRLNVETTGGLICISFGDFHIDKIQCCGSGSTGSSCFWASWIRIHYSEVYGSGSFYHHAKLVRKTLIPTIFL